MAVEDAAQLEARTRTSDVGAHHPWRRMFARQLDLIVFGVPALLILWFIASVLYPPLAHVDLDSPISELAIGSAMYGVWIPIEAGMLALAGTTPAKWLFGINIRDQNGAKLSFGRALKRASLVFIVGEGFFAIPIVTGGTRLFAYYRLTKSGITEWDRSAKSVVAHQEWSVLRWTFCALAYLAVVGVAGYLGLS